MPWHYGRLLSGMPSRLMTSMGVRGYIRYCLCWLSCSATIWTCWVASSISRSHTSYLTRIVSCRWMNSQYFQARLIPQLTDNSYLIQICAVQLFEAFKSAISNKPPDINLKDMTIALNHLFQISNSSLWAEPLHTSGLFAVFTKTLMEDKVKHLMNSELWHDWAQYDVQANVIILTEYIYVLSRIALTDRNAFLNLMSATASTQNIPEKEIWEGVLDQWWTRVGAHSSLLKLRVADYMPTSSTTCQSLDSENLLPWASVISSLQDALRFWSGCLPKSATCGSMCSVKLKRLWVKVQSAYLVFKSMLSAQLSYICFRSTLKLYWDKLPSTFWKDSEHTVEYRRRQTVRISSLFRLPHI